MGSSYNFNLYLGTGINNAWNIKHTEYIQFKSNDPNLIIKKDLLNLFRSTKKIGNKQYVTIPILPIRFFNVFSKYFQDYINKYYKSFEINKINRTKILRGNYEDKTVKIDQELFNNINYKNIFYIVEYKPTEQLKDKNEIQIIKNNNQGGESHLYMFYKEDGGNIDPSKKEFYFNHEDVYTFKRIILFLNLYNYEYQANDITFSMLLKSFFFQSNYINDEIKEKLNFFYLHEIYSNINELNSNNALDKKYLLDTHFFFNQFHSLSLDPIIYVNFEWDKNFLPQNENFKTIKKAHKKRYYICFMYVLPFVTIDTKSIYRSISRNFYLLFGFKGNKLGIAFNFDIIEFIVYFNIFPIIDETNMFIKIFEYLLWFLKGIIHSIFSTFLLLTYDLGVWTFLFFYNYNDHTINISIIKNFVLYQEIEEFHNSQYISNQNESNEINLF